MASFGIRCPRLIHNSLAPLRSNQSCTCTPCSSILKFNRVKRNLMQRVSSSAVLSDYPVVFPCNNVIGGNDNEPRLSEKPEKLDDWMRDSVVEIVKNLKQAPLLVQIYANNNDGSTKVETEKAVAENWANVNREWSDGDKQSPDGIILVEELEDENESEKEKEETRAWGVVVQGKGVEKERGPACYLLKTSRVGSGMGSFCTHFCLVKVNSFRKTAVSQFMDCWLLD